VFSVDTEEEAKQLVVLACPTNLTGQYVARELARSQTLDALEAFSDRLQELWDMLQAKKGRG
jgi:hypothetical protein